MFLEGDHKTRWIRYVPIKVNTHAWNVMTNSFPTRFNISRRGIDIDSITYANCDMGVETTSHLFFTCDMGQQVAQLITRWWDVPDLEMDSYGSWKIWMVNLRMPSKKKNMLTLPARYVQDGIAKAAHVGLFSIGFSVFCIATWKEENKKVS
ncbi:RNA-directed DNA polymerase, eukaryota [Tanacetum coccineum]